MTQPPHFVSQLGTRSTPSATRLDEVVLWDYSVTAWMVAGASIELTYNGSRSESFVVTLENADGIAQVRVAPASELAPRLLFPDTTPVAVDGALQYELAGGGLLQFPEAEGIGMRTIIVQRLDVRTIQSAQLTIDGVPSPQPLIPFLECDDEVMIGGTPATLAAHLETLLQTLLGASPFASQASLECRYGYGIGGLPIEAPVLLVTRQDVAIGFDEELVEGIADGIGQWLEAVQPPASDARLLFAISLWSGLPRTDAPLLRLARVALPMTGVAR